jgi:hypothetical protein
MFGGCATAGSSAVAPTASAQKTYVVNSFYGTLRFRGKVVRFDRVDRYEYKVRLTATFDAGARANSTSSIHLTTANLVAGISSTSTAPVQVLYEQQQPASADFMGHGERKQLPEMTFSLEKAVAARASFVRLGVTDGRLVWPASDNLK